MSWLNNISAEEKEEMYQDSCAAYHSGVINETEFRTSLALLGYNATDIADLVQFYKPPAPENELGD